ncbi:SLATT domain-containing protein [Bacillus licheniformis]|uniref:SLATT domain-containing protein n=1 Tax=Bacillus licheniformis TaxID=1402 RepID=UPI0007798D53|nr:SLATT domain-containing protein [Bacillus licheniformis]MDE1368177.1 SLATT domain-containing protein [Bacillus licheniformis]
MENNIHNILDTFGKIVYTHKTHEKAIERIEKKISRLKVFQIILLSLTTVGVASSFTDVLSPLISNTSTIFHFVNIVVLIIALVATFLSVYDMSSSDRDILYDHKNTAKQLLYIREQYLILIADYKDSAVNTDELIKKRNELLEKLTNLYNNAPSTTSKDYKKAQKSLKDEDEFTFEEGEVNRFLPPSMRG